MNRKVRYILVIILIVVSVAGIAAYRVLYAPPKTVEEMKSLSISATDLAKPYAADETKANEKYLNKAIEVTGTITGTEQNQDGGLMVLLATDDPMVAVQCAMREKNVKVENGRNVTITGICSGSGLFGVTLTGCIIK